MAHDRKVFFLDLKENERGRFLKITEDVGGRRSTIMLPSDAFQEFAEALKRLMEYEAGLELPHLARVATYGLSHSFHKSRGSFDYVDWWAARDHRALIVTKCSQR